MDATATGIGPPLVLALSIVLVSIAAAAYLVWAQKRRQRRTRRREVFAMRMLLRDYMLGRVTAERLMRDVRFARSGVYWSALEAFSVTLDRRDWRKLSLALARTPHARTERRRLVDDSSWRRVLAARRLGLTRSGSSRRALRRALRHGPEMVTLAAGMALGRYRDLAALRWLLAHPRALGRRPRSGLVGLLRAFGRRGLPEIAAALERGILVEKLELAALDILGMARYRGARDKLERLLASGTLDQRVAAARALGQLQAVECAASLLAALRDEAWPVRAQAAKALGLVGAPIAVGALAARMTDSSWWVRRHSAYALAELGADGEEALRRTAHTSPDPYARDMAREVLERPRLDVA